MAIKLRFICLAGSAVLMLLVVGLFKPFIVSNLVNAQSNPSNASAALFTEREDAYRANNYGVALLEQFKSKEAVAEFQRALALKPDLFIAKVNLAIAFFNAQELTNARTAAMSALSSEPGSMQAEYILGLIARTDNDQDASLNAFLKVLETDPRDVGANVNVGQIYSQQRRYDEALGHFKAAFDAEPYNTTAIYNLANTLQRTGSRERAAELLKSFQTLRETGAGTSIGINYLEQGRYAEAISSTGAEHELVDRTEPKVVFQNVSVGIAPTRHLTGTRSAESASVLIDLDGDGDLDLVQTSPARIYRNGKGRFADVTATSGDFAKAGNSFCHSIVAGDFDGDGKVDLFASWQSGFALYRNLGNGKFLDVTKKSLIPNLRVSASTSAFVDVDHDGDLDIVLNAVEKPSNFLFRNNGDGTFTDISGAAGVDQKVPILSIIPTDYDNRRDVDLLFLSPERPYLLRNLRNGAFRDVASDVGMTIDGNISCGAVGDFNKDGFVDFFIGRSGRPGVFAVSDGQGQFKLVDAPQGTSDATSSVLVDYDNDGLIDLIVNTKKGLVLLRNLGDGWGEPNSHIFRTNTDVSGSRQILSADLDSDGDMDLIVYGRNGSVQFLRNDGGNSNNSESIKLKGRVSNKMGIGSKIDLRAGSLAQRLETYSACPSPAPSQIHFGLGKRPKSDAVRIIWPSGIVQAEIDLKQTSSNRKKPIVLEELDRKPSSCPYLFTWNGERFEFITDFLGGGEMGDWQSAGVFNSPDPDEFVRIPPGKLVPKDGRYEVRVTNELEEVLFLDSVRLVAVEHDQNTEVYPNEGLGIPTQRQHILYTTRDARPPLSATDKDGRNVLPRIEKLDRVFYDSFRSLPIRGYAEEHTLTLGLDQKRGYRGRTLLMMTGWTDYAFSSDNVAASQTGKTLSPPKLQVINRRGEWQTVIDSIGISIGRPQTVVVDLTGKFLTDSRKVRIVSNYKTYWDQIEVDSSEQAETTATEMKPVRSELRERGFSEEVKYGPMLSANYENASYDGRWKLLTGRYTRTGDVNPLLAGIDDIFLIAKTGDELILSFDQMPPPRAGKTYTFLLYANGYSKEMDINSGSPHTVGPLPFKGMARYPFAPAESKPLSTEQLRIYDEYNTRIVRGDLPSLDAVVWP